MNRTISRIAIAAPAAAAILGFGIGAAQAAPMEITDHSEVGPNPDWNDVVVDDFDNGDPEDAPDDEPTDEPVNEDSDESDSESDEESNDEANDDSDTSPLPAPAIEPVTTSTGSTDGSASDEDAVEAFQPTTTEVTQPYAAGVHVPPLAIGAIGAAIAGIAGWATYRRQKLFN